MEEFILKTTADGSQTLFVPSLNEHYHSIHGAVQESEIVFLQNGLRFTAKKLEVINLLEIGFGTGLNALLTAIEAKKLKIRVNYVGIDPYPLPAEIAKKLNYVEHIGSPEALGYFNKLNEAHWSYPSFLSDYFVLNKIHAALEEVSFKENSFNLVYFDAFGPDVQPEMWTEHIFGILYKCLAEGGILVTYSCKGTVKRALKKAGFSIEKLPGPAGKREVLRAKKEIPLGELLSEK